MPKRRLKPDEQKAWARVARSVRALPGQPPPVKPEPASAPNPPARTSFKTAPKTGHPLPSAVKAALAVAPSAGSAAPVQNRGKERRIRRGQAAISATLDLHGHTQQTAQAQLVSFLSAQRRAGASCVLVITGKGRLGEGVLRRQLLHWLGTSEARHLVNGYAEAHRKHGGAGAWYIFLRKPVAK